MKQTGKLFVVSAPSGAGKSTLVDALCKEMSSDCVLKRVITYTTKKPRSGEKNGKDYYFISKGAFEGKIESGFFAEWSTVYGHYYGSPSSLFSQLAEGISLVLVIDRVGALKIISNYSRAVLIWIYTKNFTTLKERLCVRNTETNNEITRRLMIAQQEILHEEVNSLYHYHLLNDNLENALSELKSIVLNEIKK